MPSDSISILYDHYKDTCSIIMAAVKKRDRAMFFVLIAAGFFSFQTIFPIAADGAVVDFLSFKFGLKLQVDLTVIGNIVWLFVLLFTLRYFQTVVFVERQYAYIHRVEDDINTATGSELITREGKSYLAKYPLFSEWMHVLYTIVFPTLLFCVTTVKILGEWTHNEICNTSLGLIFNTFVFLLLSFSILLYLLMMHSRPHKKK